MLGLVVCLPNITLEAGAVAQDRLPESSGRLPPKPPPPQYLRAPAMAKGASNAIFVGRLHPLPILLAAEAWHGRAEQQAKAKGEQHGAEPQTDLIHYIFPLHTVVPFICGRLASAFLLSFSSPLIIGVHPLLQGQASNGCRKSEIIFMKTIKDLQYDDRNTGC